MPSYNILLVEDNPDHVLLIQEAFIEAQSPHCLHVVKDGLEALNFLNKENGFGNTPWPDIILLDLNLPRKNGRELLREIKGNDEFARIPVIIFTSSSAQQDVDFCYALHANCYITKPVGFDDYVDLMHMIDTFWFSAVKLPSHN